MKKDKTIIYSCPYIPAEWIVVHGMKPSRIIPHAASSIRSPARIEGVCPYVRAFVGEAAACDEASAVVVTTVCDQMRRAFDIINSKCKIPAFLMNVPNTWQHNGAKKLYLDELKRLGRFLESLGGKPGSDDYLAKVMLEYDETRASVLATRGYVRSRRYSKAIAEFGRQGTYSISSEKDVTEKKPLINAVPLAILGGPLLIEDFEIFDIVEKAGGFIALDATETGERGMCARFGRDKIQKNPLTELARAYFDGIVDASRRPNTQLYEWLKQRLDERKIRGIIFRRYLWCDLWHAELHRLKQWTELPVLDLDVDVDRQSLSTRTRHRISAFLEMLE